MILPFFSLPPDLLFRRFSFYDMDIFDDLTLLFLHKIVCKRLDEALASVRRCRSAIDRGIDKYERLAILETECNVLSALVDKLAAKIAYRDLIKNLK